jgi:predicted metallopeptidase
MGIKYELADDIMARLYDIAKTLSMEHVRLSGVYAVRSRGSGSRGTLGRCHALSKIWQLALGIKAVYIIEILSERFDKMSHEDQDRVLIHELMHIPFSFGGGFKHHDVVTSRNVEKLYVHYKKLKGYNNEENKKEEDEKEKREQKGFFRWF